MPTQAEFDQLQEKMLQLHAENVILKSENEKLIKEQAEFQDALIDKIGELKKLGPWKRFWGYWSLVKDLITTIEQGISKANN